MKAFISLFIIQTAISIAKGTICERRKQWGFACDDCRTRVMCINQNNVWEKLTIETCEEGSVCSADGQSCVESKTACAEEAIVNFECRSEGIFRDPYDCHVSHYCYKYNGKFERPVSLICPDGLVFSVRTESCMLKVDPNECEQRPYKCNSLGQMAAWPGNDRIYYICLTVSSNSTKLFPALYRCQADQRFDGFQCTSRVVTRAPPVVVQTITAKITARPQITTVTPAPPPSLSCTQMGLNKHPTNCSKYYYCDAKLNVKEYSCNSGFYFEPRNNACIKGTC